MKPDDLQRDIPRLSQAAHLELAARRVLEGVYAGRHRSPFRGSSVEFADHRPYLAGDDLRDVDWRAYARSDHLLIRRYHEERDLPLLLCCDSSASMDYGAPSKADWMLRAAAALTLMAVDQGDRVRLAAGAAGLGIWLPECGGSAGFQSICQNLSRIACEGASDLPGLLDAVGQRCLRRTMIVLFSDLLCDPESLRKPVGALRARGHEVVLFQILDRSELDLPEAWGPVRLEDPEANLAPHSCDTRGLKASYDRAMHLHITACERLCAGLGVEHQLVGTDQDLAEVLGLWLHGRRRR